MHTAFRKQARHHIGGVFRVAIHGRIRDHDALVLRLVGAPLLVLGQQQIKIPAPDRAVQRADGFDIERGRLFEQELHLCAILADNIGVIPARIVHPHTVNANFIIKNVACQRAERTECVRREQNLMWLVIGDHHFRPMHHGGHNEMQRVAAGGQLVPLCHDQCTIRCIQAIELPEHPQRLGTAHNLGVRVPAQHLVNQRAVIRLHMLYNQIIQLAPAERMGNILKELAADGIVHRVKQHGLFVQQHIAVVRHPARDGKQIFKPAQAAITAANIDKILFDLSGTVHRTTPPCNYICENCNIFSPMRLPCQGAGNHKKPAAETAGF